MQKPVWHNDDSNLLTSDFTVDVFYFLVFKNEEEKCIATKIEHSKFNKSSNWIKLMINLLLWLIWVSYQNKW